MDTLLITVSLAFLGLYPALILQANPVPVDPDDSGFASTVAAKQGYRVVRHTVSLPDPVTKTGEPQKKQLYQLLNENGIPVEYAMTVHSVSCEDTVCQVINVRMYWDVLGGYRRYELPDGVELTKYDHVPFTKSDHTRLQSILNDRRSLLKENTLELFEKPNPDAGPLHGITSATPVAIQNAVVQGAAYTSYTLWHWAHGAVTEIIQTLTEKHLDVPMLADLLGSDKRDHVLYALAYITAHQCADQLLIDAAIRNINGRDPQITDQAMAYLQQAVHPKPRFYQRLVERFVSADSKTRVTLLEYLTDKEDVPGFVYEQLADMLPSMTDYYEIHLLLWMVEDSGYVSESVLDNAAQLLSNEDVFIARRAYRFLQKQQCSETIEDHMRSFQKEHPDKVSDRKKRPDLTAMTG